MSENKAITPEKIKIAKEMVGYFIKEKQPEKNDMPLAFHVWLQILEQTID